MSWIADVIYDLKTDHDSITVTIKHLVSQSLDTDTGANTKVEQTYTVPNVLQLPETYKQAMTRILSPQRGGYSASGQRYWLIDKVDLGNHTIEINDLINDEKVVEIIEDYPEALILRTTRS